jgi:hypothetical protein
MKLLLSRRYWTKWLALTTVGFLFGYTSAACIDSNTFTPLLVQSIGTFVSGAAELFISSVVQTSSP